jgi:hypothetical protein
MYPNFVGDELTSRDKSVLKACWCLVILIAILLIVGIIKINKASSQTNDIYMGDDVTVSIVGVCTNYTATDIRNHKQEIVDAIGRDLGTNRLRHINIEFSGVP